ncbi:MAG: hypothetical protein GX781_00150 [Clostridiales bacterium]|nr:hypothetical protein [Clostridiales bacterium]
MRKNLAVLPLAICLCLALSGCTSKLTTIRPTLITRIVTQEVATGIKTDHHRKTDLALDELMDVLILQMQRQYKKTSMCTDSDKRLYDVIFYRGDSRELEVIIYSDGSVCKDGTRYVLPQETLRNSLSDDLQRWSDFIFFEKNE